MKTLTKQRKNSHLSRVRQEDTNQIEKIASLLGWTVEQYCEHQYEEFEAFIKYQCVGFPRIIRTLRYSPVFRGFWNSEWMSRNEIDFIPHAEDLTDGALYVNAIGELIEFKPVPLGAAVVVEEYLYINSYQRLMIDKEFLAKCDTIFKLIKHKEFKD